METFVLLWHFIWLNRAQNIIKRELISSSLDDDVYFGRQYVDRNEMAVKLNVKYSCLISGFRPEVDENRAPLGYCATSSGNSIPNYIQQDATLHSLLYVETALHISSGTSTIIRSACTCTHNIWYLSHRYCYRPLSWKSLNSWMVRKWVAARTVFRLCRFLSFILMEIYLGVNCFCLHIW